MTLSGYLKDKIVLILLNGLGVFFLILYLLAIGNSWSTVSLIAFVWVVIALVGIAVQYRLRKHYFQEIDDLMKSLDQPYLIQEFLGNTWRLEDRLYRNVLYLSNKAAMEQLYQLRDQQEEYREFLEGWIHEAKLPLTGMRLACHNLKADTSRIELYLTEMDHLVEQVLFYGRSAQVYKDFRVQEIFLADLIRQVIQQNKYLLMQNDMSLSILFEDCTIYSDEKWLTFILIQILLNAVKYKKAGSGMITFDVERSEAQTCLKIRDSGIGIREEELNKIFDKGFTGSNGREREKATGIGLYLCKKLCQKLEIQIGVHAVLGQYTEIYLIFPRNSYISKL